MKGFKSHLPIKFCVVCKKPMQWRKSWAKNWDLVKYCSTKCRSEIKKIRQVKPSA